MEGFAQKTLINDLPTKFLLITIKQYLSIENFLEER